jgi:hypothetical protein
MQVAGLTNECCPPKDVAGKPTGGLLAMLFGELSSIRCTAKKTESLIVLLLVALVFIGCKPRSGEADLLRLLSLFKKEVASCKTVEDYRSVLGKYGSETTRTKLNAMSDAELNDHLPPILS